MSFFGITDFWSYVLGTVAIILLPGPNSMYCLYVAGSQGTKQAYKTVAGIVIGDTLLMLAAVLGAATLLKTSPTVFFAFKVLGGLYLAYIGVSLLKATYTSFLKPAKVSEPVKKHQLAKGFQPINDSQPIKASQPTSPTTSTKATNKVFLKALTLSLSNPKAILFFLSFFLQFVDPNYASPMLSFAILGVVLQIISMVYLSVLIFSGRRMVLFFKEQRLLAALGTASVGLLFMSFAVSLWISQV